MLFHLINSSLLTLVLLQRKARIFNSTMIRADRLDFILISPPATSGETRGQRQMEPKGIRPDKCDNEANERLQHSHVSAESLQIPPHVLRPQGLRW